MAGAYLTDGSRLFRVVTPFFPTAGSGLALLEDCRTLAVEAYAARELHAMRLTAVGSPPGDAGRPAGARTAAA